MLDVDCPIFVDYSKYPSLKLLATALEKTVENLPADMLVICPQCFHGNHEFHRQDDGSCTASTKMSGSWQFCACSTRATPEQIAKNIATHGEGKKSPEPET